MNEQESDMGGYCQARADFGCEFDDGELLMSPVGSCYMLHLDKREGRGEVEKWSFSAQELTYLFRGGVYGACELWNNIRNRNCFAPNIDQLKLAEAPMSWWPHARRR